MKDTNQILKTLAKNSVFSTLWPKRDSFWGLVSLTMDPVFWTKGREDPHRAKLTRANTHSLFSLETPHRPALHTDYRYCDAVYNRSAVRPERHTQMYLSFTYRHHAKSLNISVQNYVSYINCNNNDDGHLYGFLKLI